MIFDIFFVVVENVQKYYGDFQVFIDIDLIVNLGEVVVVIGFFGLGKLMLCCMINWFEMIISGSICIDGKEFLVEGKGFVNLWVDVGMVFQLFNLFVYLMIFENVIFGFIKVCGFKKVDVEVEVMMLFNCVGVVQQVNKFFVQFFGGQQQCVVIVCVFVMQFKVMLFDELISVLDFEMINEVFDVMVEFVQDGMIMIVVMYEMGFVWKVVDCVVFMVDGWIVEEVIFEEFFMNLKSDCVKDFLLKFFMY